MLARTEHVRPWVTRFAVQLTTIDAIASALGPAPPDLGEFSSPDGALTILFSDIEDAAAIGERLGDDRWSQLLRDYRAIVERLMTHHDGSVVKSQDDGFMVTFRSAHAGLSCAVEIERTFADRPIAGLDEPLRVRIGLHCGFVIVSADEFYGRNVVLAARIANHARGGEILVSSALKEYTQTDPRFHFESRGECYFKGLRGEHLVFAVDWDR
jgi:class 3 adenylate cyclase